ncbi:MAG: N-acetylneuraminate synthase family protein [Tissierellia bacterium]|nr:N-acetylneuraminate synthase family protein [Tissierellia bacterium]
MNPYIEINGRKIGEDYKPLVIAEIGINHNGDISLAKKMVDSAYKKGCECVKFQSHVIEDEMTKMAKKVVPGNANKSIWEIMDSCKLTEKEESAIKEYVEDKGMIFLSTPFSRAAVDRLNKIDVMAYKIGSGECNNYPLIRYMAEMAKGKPIILSTGMNNLESIEKAVHILESYKAPYAILHCTSIYPTPYEKIRLKAILQLKEMFPKAVVGISDHSKSPYPVIASVAYGASIIERHYTNDKTLNGPDIEISMNPNELEMIINASEIVWLSREGSKSILEEEQVTIDFAYATVVTIGQIKAGDIFSKENIWVKRPGIGEIKAEHFEEVLGKRAKCNIDKDEHLSWSDISG